MGRILFYRSKTNIMKLGINGDSSTKLKVLDPVSLTARNKDASDMLGSGTGTCVTYEQVIDIFNSYITNTNIWERLDVDDSVKDAPNGSVLGKLGDI